MFVHLNCIRLEDR